NFYCGNITIKFYNFINFFISHFIILELHHVYCNKAFILVKLPLTSNNSYNFLNTIYWENLHSNAVKECQPLYNEREVILKVFFNDLGKCGFLRSINKLRDSVSFYQNLIINPNHTSLSKLNIKCLYKIQKTKTTKFKHRIMKRDSLPEDFQEDVDIEILKTVEQHAPEPQVLMEVRQNDQLIDGMVTVIPGTPLVMEIKLDEASNDIYGLSVNYLQVTDMAEMSETILFKGCTVDPYLFENFNLTNKKSLKSKFRAFKFPNTAFVQFRANVKICLQNCAQPQCIGSNSKQSRKRRHLNNPPKQVYEMLTSFVIKLNETYQSNEAELQQLQNHVQLLHTKNLHIITLK
ncbi:hypothetical protein CVS40_10652, partial [Lucilia cuprina]